MRGEVPYYQAFFDLGDLVDLIHTQRGLGLLPDGTGRVGIGVRYIAAPRAVLVRRGEAGLWRAIRDAFTTQITGPGNAFRARMAGPVAELKVRVEFLERPSITIRER